MHKYFQSKKKKKKEANGKLNEMQNIFVKGRSCQSNPTVLGLK